jgi:hypothetical protein
VPGALKDAIKLLACRLAAGMLPSNTGNIAPGNADIGQFTVAQMGKFLHRGTVSLPGLYEADDWQKHVFLILSPGYAPESRNKYRNFLSRCNKIGAAQLIQKCMR